MSRWTWRALCPAMTDRGVTCRRVLAWQRDLPQVAMLLARGRYETLACRCDRHGEVDARVIWESQDGAAGGPANDNGEARRLAR